MNKKVWIILILVNATVLQAGRTRSLQPGSPEEPAQEVPLVAQQIAALNAASALAKENAKNFVPYNIRNNPIATPKTASTSVQLTAGGARQTSTHGYNPLTAMGATKKVPVQLTTSITTKLTTPVLVPKAAKLMLPAKSKPTVSKPLALEPVTTGEAVGVGVIVSGGQKGSLGKVPLTLTIPHPSEIKNIKGVPVEQISFVAPIAPPPPPIRRGAPVAPPAPPAPPKVRALPPVKTPSLPVSPTKGPITSVTPVPYGPKITPPKVPTGQPSKPPIKPSPEPLPIAPAGEPKTFRTPPPPPPKLVRSTQGPVTGGQKGGAPEPAVSPKNKLKPPVTSEAAKPSVQSKIESKKILQRLPLRATLKQQESFINSSQIFPKNPGGQALLPEDAKQNAQLITQEGVAGSDVNGFNGQVVAANTKVGHIS